MEKVNLKNYQEAISFIESRRNKHTFNQFKTMLEKYNIDTNFENVIHIAGTNGKGSTANFITKLLLKKGYRVGTYSSPYIIKHNERIKVNDEMIEDEVIYQLIKDNLQLIVEEDLAMFEIDTLLMIQYFNRLDLDYWVIECGIGGKEDKTNVLTGKYAAITNINLDHQFMLGNSVAKIAYHKAGIIKNNQATFTTEKKEQALSVINKEAAMKNASLEVLDYREGSNTFAYKGKEFNLEHLASYQVPNLLLSITLVNKITNVTLPDIDWLINQDGLPARFEKIGNYYLDGAHNVAAIKELITTIKLNGLENPIIIFGSLDDKDSDEMCEILHNFPLIKASFDDPRQRSEGENFKDIVKKYWDKGDILVFTGSLHFVSQVREFLLSNM